MLRRLHIYFREMYPLALRLLMAAVLFLSPWFAFRILGGAQELTISWVGIGGVLTFFFFLMGLRISDEFKDYELDCKLFPDRPLPSGRVTHRDLRVALVAVVALLLIINTVIVPLTGAFALLMFYGFLMYNFFFIKARIQKSLMLALITHNPVVILLQFYTAALAALESAFSPLSLSFLHVAFLFFLPGLTWELARKVRAPQDENEYETYSQVFGYRMAAFNPAILYAVHLLLMVLLAGALGLSVVYLVLLALVACWACGLSLRFVFNPNSKTAQLRPAAEVYALLANGGFLVDLALSRGLGFSF
jgi:4-hydroxybenzoate polyprenyltransferase